MPKQISFLPSDEILFERSKLWAAFCSRILAEENNEEFKFDEIPSQDEDDTESDTDVDENIPINNCGALVKVNNFEHNSSSDKDDMENLLNETLPIIEERKRKWKDSGMDKILDTFDLTAITDKVGSWLKKARLEEDINSSSLLEDAQIMHFENHSVQLNSDDSLQSTDTAKYILSNRKFRSASCTTMTIKRYRYVKGKQRELQRKYNNLSEFEFDDVFNKKCTELQPTLKYKPVYCAKSEEAVRPKPARNPGAPVRRKAREENLTDSLLKVSPNIKHEPLCRQKSRHRKRRSKTLRKRSMSSSSSSKSTSNSGTLHVKSRFRRVSRRLNINNEPQRMAQLTSIVTRSSDSRRSPTRIVSPVTTLNKQLKLPASSLNVKEVEVAQSSNSTFPAENIANSTDSYVKTNSQLSSIVSNNLKRYPVIILKRLCEHKANTKSQKNEIVIKKEDEQVEANIIPCTPDFDRKVLIYTPENRTLCRKSNSNNFFELTEEHLRKFIGVKAAERFIKFDARRFPIKFDSSSTVYFKLPTESENSHQSGSDGDSEEDILDMFGKQGELIEQPTPEISCMFRKLRKT